MIQSLRVFEHDRFEVTKKMNNVLVDTEDLQMIPEEAELMVDFAEIVVQKTPQETMDERDWQLEKNLTSLVEILKEINPDLDDSQAEKMIQNNKTSNSTLAGKASRFELLTKPEEEVNE